ncbi:MAG: hypothetical protein RI959_463, partial [Pseudomonadota bacterium]
PDGWVAGLAQARKLTRLSSAVLPC